MYRERPAAPQPVELTSPSRFVVRTILVSPSATEIWIGSSQWRPSNRHLELQPSSSSTLSSSQSSPSSSWPSPHSPRPLPVEVVPEDEVDVTVELASVVDV